MYTHKHTTHTGVTVLVHVHCMVVTHLQVEEVQKTHWDSLLAKWLHMETPGCSNYMHATEYTYTW